MLRARRTIGAIVKFYWGDGIAADVPALAYFLLISLAPFLLGVATLTALLTSGEALVGSITQRLTGTLPPELSQALTSLVNQTTIDSPWLLTLAIFGCLWTSSGAVGVIARCANRLLGRQPHLPSLGRLHELALAGGVLLMVVAMAGLGAISGGAAHRLHLPVDSWAVPLLSWVVVLAVLFLVLWLAPRGRLRPLAALAGALPASLALQVVPAVVGLYVRHAAGVNVARIFFLMVVLVLACSLSAQALLISTGLACKLERRRNTQPG